MDQHEQLKKTVPSSLAAFLEARDGAAGLAVELPRTIQPADAATPSDGQQAWERCGLYYLGQGRFHEALSIFSLLYDHMLTHQEATNSWVHKGMPLVWMSECHAGLDHPVHAKRYLMLTTCEDAIRDKGQIPPESGVYFRLVWHHGVSHQDVGRYAAAIWEIFQKDQQAGLFPEWILQELDQEWLTEYPSSREATLFSVSTRYVRWLLDRLGQPDGTALERLAHYLLGSMPGCRAYRRSRSYSTDYDVICALEGPLLDFRSELGRYFISECKVWSRPADFTAFAKFCRVLDSAKCQFGILFSKMGVSGAGTSTAAEREQLNLNPA